MVSHLSYLGATRHPWSCFLFLLPLLLGYEVGVYAMGGANTQALRNGADAWLRWVLDVYGVKPFLAAPLLLVALFLLWSAYRWGDRPSDTLGVYCGMWFESILFAFGMWLLGHNFGMITRSIGVRLATMEVSIPTDALALIVTYIGAGIYEEVLFRLFLITGLVGLFKYAFIPGIVAMPMAVLSSALLFAAAHHFGESGEPMDSYRFLYRTTAGVYFALIYWLRGFGIAVGAHAVYDVLVGVRFQV